jgi:radical SAM superfamily enzyme YgiQ (UPF0313 family)
MTVKWCVICSSKYKDENIKNLEGASNSVKKLQSVVVSKLGVPADDTLFIYDGTRDEITKAIVEFCEKLANDDIVVFCFCGHGIKVRNHLYLLVENSNKENVEITSLEYKLIVDLFKNKKIKRIVAILDCCNSGAAINMGIENGTLITNEGQVTICSCSEVEESVQLEIENGSECAFTYTFAKILSRGSSVDKPLLSINDIMQNLTAEYKKISNLEIVVANKQDLDKYEFIKNMDYIRKNDARINQELDEIRDKITRRKKWKVLLVKCEIKYPTRGIDFGVPLGLWVIKNYITLSKPNVQVDIYDERLNITRGEETNFEQVITDYDVIGISMCTCEVPMAIKKFKIAHEMGKITVAGGIFTYSNEKYLIDTKVVDYVIPGVGTIPWIRLLDALMANDVRKESNINVNNVFSKNNLNTTVWLTDTMPRMELHEWDEIISKYSPFINKETVIDMKKVTLPKLDIVTSRGCNQRCRFCSVRFETGSSVICKTYMDVEDEIDYLYSKGIRYFSIKDEDCLIHGNERFEEIMNHCKQYKDIRFKVRMRLDAWNKYGGDFNMEKLREWGIDEIQYGVESPQSDILILIQKGMSFERDTIINLFKEHYKNKIKVNASFILGCAELEKKDYYANLKEFINNIYDEDYLIPYLNFYTPHPTYSTILNDQYTVTTDDFNYYTHKIPVAYPKNMTQPERASMIQTYEEITNITSSKNYNPDIPRDAKDKFLKGKQVQVRNRKE